MVAAAGRDTAIARTGVRQGSSDSDLLSGFFARFGEALEREWSERRFFLWVPVAAGAGVVVYFQADREPSLAFAVALTLLCLCSTIVLRRSRRGLVICAAALALFAGFTAAALRTTLLEHAMLDRIRIVKLTGILEEVDHRRQGARFVLRVMSAPDDVISGGLTRVRLTTKRTDPIEAGMTVALTARLVPPARAVLPGGYDFARDAYFAGFDAVGSVLGRIVVRPMGEPSELTLRLLAAVDNARNALAARVSTILPGDTGAIAAAMVTGKRDLLSDDGRELIREAGIFHIITIAGVQMTLVAGLLFGVLRAGLAAVPTLALRFPIKTWAAAGAMAGSVAYDILTGSRIGTQRALFMTLIMLGAIMVDRRALTMRNLALAALVVIAFEPETILGASFQLSFAAVAALVAVQEARLSRGGGRPADTGRRGPPGALRIGLDRAAGIFRGAGRLVLATVAATSATAPVMASNFHEISPFVVIGNPLTLAIIEFFAVPGALIGSVLYPLGLDRFVWHWVGWGIGIVLWAARLIAASPGATLHVPAFAPWAPACFALATCSAVIWRSTMLRLTALPLLAAGFFGATAGPRYDLMIAPTGDTVAWRTAAGSLAVVGRNNAFGAEQWLSADGDGREPPQASGTAAGARCDGAACLVHGPADKLLSLVAKPDAFEEDCRRADIIVTPLFAPASCAAEVIVDRGTLAATGALGFTLHNGALLAAHARSPGENRPWSKAPVIRPALASRSRDAASLHSVPSTAAPSISGTDDDSDPSDDR